MKTCSKGITLVELLVGLMVAAIVILTIGAIGTIAGKSYNDLRNKSGVYNDSMFALELIRENVRQAQTIVLISGRFSRLMLKTAMCTNINYYIQRDPAGFRLVYDSVCGSTVHAATPIITGVQGLVFNLTPVTSSFVVQGVSFNRYMLRVNLSGTNAGVTFNYTINVLRRVN